MKGILYPAGNGKLKTDDNADIEIDGGVERIFARAHGYNKTDFQDGAGTILFRSRPANRRSAGRLRELKEVDFCLEDSVIAQVRYPKFLGPPEYWIGSSALAVTITVEE